MYYTNNGWSPTEKGALRLTRPRAEEIVDSLMLKVSKGWEMGDYVIVEAEA